MATVNKEIAPDNTSSAPNKFFKPTDPLLSAPPSKQPVVQTGASSQQASPSISQVQQLGASYGFDQNLLGYISDAASNNSGLLEYTPEKQAVYDAYQSYLSGQIQQKAQQGIGLNDPTPYKQQLYDQYSQQSQQSNSNAQLQAMLQYLQQSADAQLQQQQAQLGQARDQQLAAIQKQLNDAVARGEISIREAEAQFESSKQAIQQQAYTNNEFTQLASQQRGIANSQQSLGLIQGDQQRTNSLLNQNLTARDKQINDISSQLNAIRNNAAIDINSANSQYEYALANAQGQIAQQLNQNIYEFQSQDYFQNQQQTFDLAKLSTQQRYQLEQFAVQQGYDLEKLSTQQQYALAQNAQQYGFNLNLQNNQQQFQSGENQLDRNFTSTQNQLNRDFQAQQSAADRSAQFALQSQRTASEFALLNARQQLEFQAQDREIQRKLAFYTPGTKEYQALELESNFAFQQLARENAANQAAEIGHLQLANVLSSYPTTQPNPNNKKQVDAYNLQVDSLNKQLNKLLGPDGQKYTRDLINSTYGSSGASSQEKISQATNLLLKTTPASFTSTFKGLSNLLKQ